MFIVLPCGGALVLPVQSHWAAITIFSFAGFCVRKKKDRRYYTRNPQLETENVSSPAISSVTGMEGLHNESLV